MNAAAPPHLPWLNDPNTPLPEASAAWDESTPAPGLVAVGGAPTIARLEEAYGKGIFPWYSPGEPALWWSPTPRLVLFPDEFRVHRSLRRTLRQFMQSPGCEIRCDSAFERVIAACAGTARPGQKGTWIVPEMIQAYTAWHHAGRVHSFETWVDGALVGGLYGVSLGHVFFGESMFSHASNASKLALAALVAHARASGIALIDCQQSTAHLASLGAREIDRSAFIQTLKTAATQATPAEKWRFKPQVWSLLPGLNPESSA
jgi:leucyl/phenylalanyl-tRNA--protein transferase